MNDVEVVLNLAFTIARVEQAALQAELKVQELAEENQRLVEEIERLREFANVPEEASEERVQ